MKVADGTLDPNDSYESEWVGTKGPGNPTVIGGDGTAPVGIGGRVVRNNEVNAIGLLFPPGANPQSPKLLVRKPGDPPAIFCGRGTTRRSPRPGRTAGSSWGWRWRRASTSTWT